MCIAPRAFSMYWIDIICWYTNSKVPPLLQVLAIKYVNCNTALRRKDKWVSVRNKPLCSLPAGVFINTFRIVRIVLLLTRGTIHSFRPPARGAESVRNKHVWQLWLKFTSLVLISFLQVRFLLTFSGKVIANNFTPEINQGVWVLRLLLLVTVIFAMWSIHCLLQLGMPGTPF